MPPRGPPLRRTWTKPGGRVRTLLPKPLLAGSFALVGLVVWFSSGRQERDGWERESRGKWG